MICIERLFNDWKDILGMDRNVAFFKYSHIYNCNISRELLLIRTTRDRAIDHLGTPQMSAPPLETSSSRRALINIINIVRSLFNIGFWDTLPIIMRITLPLSIA